MKTNKKGQLKQLLNSAAFLYNQIIFIIITKKTNQYFMSIYLFVQSSSSKNDQKHHKI